MNQGERVRWYLFGLGSEKDFHTAHWHGVPMATPEAGFGELRLDLVHADKLSAGDVDLQDFLARADLLATAGKTVLISDYSEYYRLAAYLARHTREPIALAMGAAGLQDLFQEKYYAKLEGGILEAFDRGGVEPIEFGDDIGSLRHPLRLKQSDDAGKSRPLRACFSSSSVRPSNSCSTRHRRPTEASMRHKWRLPRQQQRRPRYRPRRSDDRGPH